MERTNRRQHRHTGSLYSVLLQACRALSQGACPLDGGEEIQKEREQSPHILLKAKFKNHKMNSCIQQIFTEMPTKPVPVLSTLLKPIVYLAPDFLPTGLRFDGIFVVN